jgi:hypothetical protein
MELDLYRCRHWESVRLRRDDASGPRSPVRTHCQIRER